MRVFSIAMALAGCASPASAPQIFAQDLISTAEWESHPAISSDGSILLFVRSDSNFSGWKIFESRRKDGGWSAPAMASFSGKYLDADPFFSDDGRTLYFISTRPAAGKKGDDLDIWSVDRAGEGWDEPKRLPEPVNSDGQEWFPRMAADGVLYFGSDRKGGLGQTDIYAARRDGGAYIVRNLGAPISSEGDEYEFAIAPDGRFAILMASRADGLGGGDLYLSWHEGEGWRAPLNLGPTINSENLEVGPWVSRDGKTFYWSSARERGRLGDIFMTPVRDLLKLAPKQAAGT